MRTLFAAALVAGLAAATAAQDPKPVPAAKIQPPKDAPVAKRPDATLKVGDPAPALKATKWLQGEEVKEFAKDKIYVVEFWATWCGPCIVMMPHMGEMQAEFKSKGVTFIGYSAKDPNNSMEKVAAMVEKRGPKLGYTFAFAEDRDTYDAWMKAANQNGIPCCFVVGRDSKIAYIGHPMYLDIVLPKVVAGTWKGADDAAAMKKVDDEVGEVFKSFGGDPEAGLARLAEFESKYPEMKDVPYFRGPRLTMMMKAGKFDQAKAAAEALISKGMKQEDPLVLQVVSSTMRGPLAKDKKDLMALSVRAAEAGLKIAGEKDARALLNVAEAHFAAGDKAKAQEYGKKALAASDAESPAMKKFIESQVKKFDQ